MENANAYRIVNRIVRRLSLRIMLTLSLEITSGKNLQRDYAGYPGEAKGAERQERDVRGLTILAYEVFLVFANVLTDRSRSRSVLHKIEPNRLAKVLRPVPWLVRARAF